LSSRPERFLFAQRTGIAQWRDLLFVSNRIQQDMGPDTASQLLKNSAEICFEGAHLQVRRSGRFICHSRAGFSRRHKCFEEFFSILFLSCRPSRLFVGEPALAGGTAA